MNFIHGWYDLDNMSDNIRDKIKENLIESYSKYYDITKSFERKDMRCDDDNSCSAEPYFQAECDFNMRSEKFFLSKQAKLWAVDSFEYVFIFSVPYLTDIIYDRCLSYSYETGMKRIVPGPEHMCSYISMIILCDDASKTAVKKLRRCHLHKDFRFSLYGWMDFHTAVVVTESGDVTTNLSGRDNAKNLKTIYQSQKGRKV